LAVSTAATASPTAAGSSYTGQSASSSAAWRANATGWLTPSSNTCDGTTPAFSSSCACAGVAGKLSITLRKNGLLF
jgi:hypothetical protein